MSQPAGQILSQLLLQGASLESALAAMRSHGTTQVETIKAIREVPKVSLGEAKRIFSSSPAWHAENESADRLHEELLAMLSKEQAP